MESVSLSVTNVKNGTKTRVLALLAMMAGNLLMVHVLIDESTMMVFYFIGKK